jgi:hypothetical protein
MMKMINVDNVIYLIREMIHQYQMKYDKRPTMAYLGDAQIDAMKAEDLRYSAIGEESRICGLKIIRANTADFAGVGSEENEMSAISPDLVKARAAQMLGDHFRKIDFPNALILGYEQMQAARESDSFHMSRIDIEHFHGVRLKLLPVPNYIGVI